MKSAKVKNIFIGILINTLEWLMPFAFVLIFFFCSLFTFAVVAGTLREHDNYCKSVTGLNKNIKKVD